MPLMGNLRISGGSYADQIVYPTTKVSQIVDFHTALDAYMSDNIAMYVSDNIATYMDSNFATYIRNYLASGNEISITGPVNVTGNVSVTGDTTITGNSSIAGTLTADTVEYTTLQKHLPQYDGSATGDPTSLYMYMKNACPSDYTTLTDVSEYIQFKTNNVQYAQYVFQGCAKVTSINLVHWAFDNSVSMNKMFQNCTSLQNITLPTEAHVNDMGGMFEECSALEAVDLSSLDLSQCDNYSWLFYNCKALKSVGNVVFDLTKSQSNIGQMFGNCTKLGTLGVTLRFKNVPSSVFADEANLKTTINAPSGCNVVIESWA